MRTFKSKTGTAYYTVWCKALGTFLGWSEEEVYRWASRFTRRLDNDDDLLYNDTPMQCIADLFIPKALTDKLSQDKRRELRREIRYAIEINGSGSTFRNDFDWDAAKARVNEVLERRGVKLPEKGRKDS